jgi:hypothetical protein
MRHLAENSIILSWLPNSIGIKIGLQMLQNKAAVISGPNADLSVPDELIGW